MDSQNDRIASLEEKVEALEALLVQQAAELQDCIDFRRCFYETPEPVYSTKAVWVVDRQEEVNRHLCTPDEIVFHYGEEAINHLRRQGFGV